MGLENNFFTLPLSEEIEVSIFGTGGGYGEAAAIKLKDSDWVIIDSCINPNTKEPLALSYLKKIGVDIKRDVKWVICTHWHNDHIMGLSQTLKECESAKFCMPSVNDRKKFLQFVGLDCSKVKKGSISSFNEFRDCMLIMNDRKKHVKRISSDCYIYNEILEIGDDNRKINIELASLSPSDSAVANFDHELSSLLNNFSITEKSVIEKSANEKSVVILLKYNGFSALLGADLEIGNKEDEGWSDIYNNSVLVKDKSIIYKIPHHGSKNGYDKTIYEGLVDDDAILKLTPWNRGEKLPQFDMLKVYSDHSPNLYITSALKVSSKPKKRDKSVEKIINQFSRKLSEVKFDEGIIRSRHNLTKVDEKIKVETYGGAFKVE